MLIYAVAAMMGATSTPPSKAVASAFDQNTALVQCSRGAVPFALAPQTPGSLTLTLPGGETRALQRPVALCLKTEPDGRADPALIEALVAASAPVGNGRTAVEPKTRP